MVRPKPRFQPNIGHFCVGSAETAAESAESTTHFLIKKKISETVIAVI